MSYPAYNFTDLQNAVIHALHGTPNANAPAAQTVNRALGLLTKMRPWRWRMKTMSIDVVQTAIDKSINRISNVVTVGQTSHQFSVGSSVAVVGAGNTSFNGQFIVTASTALPTFSVTAARATNVLTITLKAHGLLVGNHITISNCSTSAINGTYVVATVATDTFTVASTGADVAVITGYVTPVVQTITTIARATNVVTVSLVAHGIQAGNSVTIIGCSDTSFNGTFTVATAATDSFTINQTAADATPTTAGQLTPPAYLAVNYFQYAQLGNDEFAVAPLGGTIPGALFLPADFDGIVALKCAINSFRECYPVTMDDLWLRRQYAYGAAYETFFALNWLAQKTTTDVPRSVIEVHPIPQSAGPGLFVGTYMRMVPKLVNGTDIPDIPAQYHDLLLVLCRALAVSTEEDRVGSDWELFGRMVQDLAADEGASQGPIVGQMRNTLNRGWRPSPFYPAGRIQA